MYVKYCENKFKLEFIVVEYSDIYFEVCYIINKFIVFLIWVVDYLNLMFLKIKILSLFIVYYKICIEFWVRKFMMS